MASLVDSPGDCLCFAHRSHPGASGSPSGFRSRQISKRCGQRGLPENRFPRKVCKQSDTLAPVVPVPAIRALACNFLAGWWPTAGVDFNDAHSPVLSLRARLRASVGRAPDPAVELWQDRLTPLWKRIGGACHLNRKIDGIIKAGFQIPELTKSYIPGH